MNLNLSVSLLAFVLWAVDSSQAVNPQKKVLVIGIDGTRPDSLVVAQTPTLDRLMAEGAYSLRAVTDPITHSAACWSSMFTGVWGDKHGVQDPGNSFDGNRFAAYPNFLKRLEQANSNLNTVVFARWAPLTNATAGSDLMQAFGSDASIVTETCRQLTNANPDAFYTILLDVDSAGHSYGWGPAVTNYVKAIETADGRVEQILNALTNRATYASEDWLVIVLSDHGQHDRTIEESQITFHIVYGPSAARGEMRPAPSIVDVCATVLTHLGVPIDPAWNLDARVEGLPLPPPRYGTNLIFNGDAESNSGTNGYAPNRGIAWWSDHTSVTLGVYGAHPNFPSLTSPGSAQRGNNFFLGGANGTTNLCQIIDLGDLASDIDDPGVNYELSGWFGGFSNQADFASLRARFLGESDTLRGTNQIGPVSAADRTNATGMLAQQTRGVLPAGTRKVEFVLSMTAPAGMNDASADNLSFVLTPVPEPQPIIGAYGFTNRAWFVEFTSRSNRLHALDRSVDLRTWDAASPEVAGTGEPMQFLDESPPADGAFYRVKSRKPPKAMIPYTPRGARLRL